MSGTTRRRFAAGLAAIGSTTALGLHRASAQDARRDRRRQHQAARGAEPRITPGEDLMREHGVSERILVVWSVLEAPIRRGDPVDFAPLRSSVDLLQRFIESYHERMEEEHVFPRLRQAGHDEDLVRTLLSQHDAGHRMTREIGALLARPELDRESRGHLADRMAEYAQMYRAHMGHENTIAFPDFARAVGHGYVQMGDLFEEREHQILGANGFEHAVTEVAAIESALRLSDLSAYTPADLRGSSSASGGGRPSGGAGGQGGGGGSP